MKLRLLATISLMTQLEALNMVTRLIMMILVATLIQVLIGKEQVIEFEQNAVTK